MGSIGHDLSGHRFNRLVALNRTAPLIPTKSKKWFWLCQCDCGKQKIVSSGHLKNGGAKSCGCLRVDFCKKQFATHRKSRTKIHAVWATMKARCLTKTSLSYPRYGGSGITVSDDWLVFENFYRDMGECPDGLSLDRKDNNLGYSKENCRWATKTEQARNKRRSLIFLYQGERKHLKELCVENGVKYGTVWRRLKHGWPIDRALSRIDGRDGVSHL